MNRFSRTVIARSAGWSKLALVVALLSLLPAAADAALTLTSISLTDPSASHNQDTSAYTNNATVDVTLAGADASATSVHLSEASDFATSTTTAYTGSGPYSFTLTGDDGSKTVYAMLSSASDSSAAQNDAIELDTDAPGVSSITTAVSGATNSDSVSFTVVFDEDVYDFTNAGVAVSLTSGTSTGVTVTPVSATDYTVTVVGLDSDGELRITINANAAWDRAGNGNGASAASDPVVVDTIPPEVETITPVDAGPTAATAISWTVQWTENVNGFTGDDVTVIHTDDELYRTFGGDPITVTKNQDDNYTVTLNDIGGDGQVRISIGADKVTDKAGNGNLASDISPPILVDHIPPKMWFKSTQRNPTIVSAVPVTVGFSERVIGFESGDLAPSAGSVSGFGGSGANYSFTLNMPAAKGLVTVTVTPPAGVEDLAGNPLLEGATFEMIRAYHVKKTGTADYRTIQAAIDAISDGHAIVVTGGEGAFEERISFKGKNIIVESSNPLDPNVVKTTAISASGQGILDFEPVVTCFGTEPRTARLAGFSIINGKGTGVGTYPNIQSYGGGINGNGALLTIEHCAISGNAATWGAGINDCDGLIRNNLIAHNLAEKDGGGLNECDGDIHNNTIVYNRADSDPFTRGAQGGDGGGLATCLGEIANNIIYHNINETAAAPDQLHDSSNPTYSCVEGGSAGAGNISGNPLLVNPDPPDLNDADVHLQAGSPCIDAGKFIGETIIDGHGRQRPIDGRNDGQPGGIGQGSDFDMGLFEYYVNGSSTPDANVSGIFVSPITDFSATRGGGGVFDPASKAYRVTNVGRVDTKWTASFDVDWLKTVPESELTTSILVPNETDIVSVAFNGNAALLAQGTHTGVVTFEDGLTDFGNTPRSVIIDAGGTSEIPNLEVTPAIGITATGPEGGPFEGNTSVEYQLRNTGGGTLTWTATRSENWSTISVASGSLAAGAFVNMTVSLNSNANSLLAEDGPFTDDVIFTNTVNGAGDTSRTMVLTVTISQTGGPIIGVSPEIDFEASGPEGGSFTPGTFDYVVANAGDQTMDWSVSGIPSWLTFSSTGGTLPADDPLTAEIFENQTTVTLTINSEANALAAGTYDADLAFSNDTDGEGNENSTRRAVLTIAEPGDDGYGDNDTLEDAYDLSGDEDTPLSEINGPAILAGDDWWEIRIEEGSEIVTIDCTFTHANGNIDIDLVDAQGIVLATSVSATDNEHIEFEVPAAGVYYIHVYGSNEDNTYDLQWSTQKPASLEVTPLDAYSANGNVGGPFSPPSKAYQLTNIGDRPLDWGAAKLEAWVELDNVSGTIAAGQSVVLTVSINSQANALAKGSADDIVLINNTTNGRGSTSRNVLLQIGDDDFEDNDTRENATDITDNEGNPLSDLTSDTIVQSDDDWYQITVPDGQELVIIDAFFDHAGGDINIELYDDNAFLIGSASSGDDNEHLEQVVAGGGTYYIRVTGGNTGNDYDLVWNTQDPNNRLAILLVTPETDFASAGPIGGPFSPVAANYTVSNVGAGVMDWTVAAAADWVGLNQAGSTLNPGQTTDVTASVRGAVAIDLVVGEYPGTLTFTNAGDPANLLTVNTTLTVGDDLYEDNDTRENAHDLGPVGDGDDDGWLSDPEHSPGSGGGGPGGGGDGDDNPAEQNDDDWYVVNVTGDNQRLTVNALFEHAGGNIDIEIYNANGDLLGTANSMTDNEHLAQLLGAAGDYYIRVYGDNAGNDYDLHWTLDDPLQGDSGVVSVRPHGDGYTASGPVGGGFTPLSKTFTLLNAGTAAMTWTATKTAAWLLLDTAGGTLNPGETAIVTATIEQLVAAGLGENIYLDALILAGSGAEGSENIAVRLIVGDDNYGNNDSLDQAFDLSDDEGTSLSQLLGDGEQSDDDWYKITVRGGSTQLSVDALFQHAGGDINIELYDANGNLVAASYSATDNEHMEQLEPAAGVYYIRVTGTDSGNTYDLVWSLGGATTTWYFAEGDTREAFGYQTYLLVVNPNDLATTLALTIYFPDTDPLEVEASTEANSRYTFALHQLLPANGRPQSSFAMKLNAALPVYAERAMYWAPGGVTRGGGTDATGSPLLANEWILAEGTTTGNRETLILVGNPNSTASKLEVTYLLQGESPTTVSHTVGANRRLTIDTAVDVADKNFSTQVRSTNQVPVIVERTMYGPADGVARKWGHTALGRTATSNIWYLAEGAVHSTFETFILLANPNNEEITANVRFLRTGQPPVTKQKVVPANSRETINVELEYAEMLDVAGFSTEVSTVGGQGILVERAMYWKSAGYNQRSGATAAFGAPLPNRNWFLPEGAVGGNSGFENFILLGNPTDQDANLTVTFVRDDGQSFPASLTVLPANSRATVKANFELLPQAGTQSISTIVEVEESHPGIVVERVMYWNNRLAGHASYGIPQ
ncbi:pre-peptidase C-terminal domain-containing protein [Candidatus Sumerlaeota bacterium]